MVLPPYRTSILELAMAHFGVTSGNPYISAYVPAYVDWRHTYGRGYGGYDWYDLDSVPKDIVKKLDRDKEKQAVRAHAERMKYVSKFKKFKDNLCSQFQDQNLTQPAVELVGSEIEPKKDLIIVSYIIDDDSSGKMDVVQDFVVKALTSYDLHQFFRPTPSGSLPDQEEEDHVLEPGDPVVWLFPRLNHENEKLDKKPIDFMSQDDEDGGGSAGF